MITKKVNEVKTPVEAFLSEVPSLSVMFCLHEFNSDINLKEIVERTELDSSLVSKKITQAIKLKLVELFEGKIQLTSKGRFVIKVLQECNGE